jgi:MoaA/NifB/PqqE/SkfB family radical SAM enzyme
MCKRGVTYITDYCNASCIFCYYQKFLKKKKHKPFQEVKMDVEKQRFYYNLETTDITGTGEPTLHPQIRQIIQYCVEINLKPTIITNGLLPDTIKELISDGLDDLLLSIEGVGEVHDESVGVKGAFHKVLKTIGLLRSEGFNFRTNTVLTKVNMENLPALAEFLVEVEPKMVNFISFNPHEGTEWSKQDNIEFQAKYSEIAPHLKKAIDILNEHGIWVNVRYFPLCILRGYEKYVCNFRQNQYDPYEWNLIEGFELTREEMKELTQEAINERIYGHSDEEKLLNHLVSRMLRGNVMASFCRSCVNFLICDGLYSQYARRFGFQELKPIEEDYFIKNPIYYRLKDLRWLGNGHSSRRRMAGK